MQLQNYHKLDYVEIYATKNRKNHLGVISFNIKGVHPHDVASILDSYAMLLYDLEIIVHNH